MKKTIHGANSTHHYVGKPPRTIEKVTLPTVEVKPIAISKTEEKVQLDTWKERREKKKQLKEVIAEPVAGPVEVTLTPTMEPTKE